jgi:hypothetical protein
MEMVSLEDGVMFVRVSISSHSLPQVCIDSARSYVALNRTELALSSASTAIVLTNYVAYNRVKESAVIGVIYVPAPIMPSQSCVPDTYSLARDSNLRWRRSMA